MKPTATEFDRRIVLRVMSGKRTGLRMIMGLRSQLNPEAMLPSRIDHVGLHDHIASVRLIGTKNRYILYAEDPTTARPMPAPSVGREPKVSGRKAPCA